MKVAEDANIIAMAKVINEEHNKDLEKEQMKDDSMKEEQTTLDV